MHDGCSGAFQPGKQIAYKIRVMGFNTSPLVNSLEIDCSNCDTILKWNGVQLSLSRDDIWCFLPFTQCRICKPAGAEY